MPIHDEYYIIKLKHVGENFFKQQPVVATNTPPDFKQKTEKNKKPTFSGTYLYLNKY